MKSSILKVTLLVTTILLSLLACQKEEMIRPASSSVHLQKQANFPAPDLLPEATTDQKQPSDFFNDPANILVTYESCDDVILEMANLFQPLADKNCESYYYCVLCMQDNALAYITGIITPKNCPDAEAHEPQAINQPLLGSLNTDFLAHTSEELSEKFSPANSYPTVSVAIQANCCINGGEALTVYKPDDWYAFEGDRYLVQWFYQLEPISSNVTTPCLLGGEYIVIVFDLKLQAIAGIAFYSVPCNTDKL